MSFVDAREKRIAGVLQGRKFAIDEYQREYKWQTKHLEELLEDLYNAFSRHYDENHERREVAHYPGYFLGSIIINKRDNQDFIVDGQQRITTLTLLLIYIRNLKRDNPELTVPDFDDCIYSEKYGDRSFNLDIPERRQCLEALFAEGQFEGETDSQSVRNMMERYEDLNQLFPRNLEGPALPFFVDWLLEKVELVEITATSNEDAYTIFETMNDRGRPLSSLDMLKGYLLSQLPDETARIQGNAIWKQEIRKLNEIQNEAGSDFAKNWLRSRYAETFRSGSKGAVNEDFEKIGTAFHKWVRDNRSKIGLQSSNDFEEFLMQLLPKYAGVQRRALEASKNYPEGLKPIYRNECVNFTFQYPLLLAPVELDDNEEIILEKMHLVAEFCSIYIARRAVNYKTLDYSAIKHAMFNFMKEIRGLDVYELSDYLKGEIQAMDETWDGTPDGRIGVEGFGLNNWSKRYIRYMLARMTSYIEIKAGRADRFAEYAARGRQGSYEIEHILADHPDRHVDEFEHPEDFREHRNRFAGLLLLPGGFNQSYGDLPYNEKRKHYLRQNLLAASLHPDAYERDPGFVRYVERSGLPFKPIERFDKEAMESRTALYRALCKEIWTHERLNVREY